MLWLFCAPIKPFVRAVRLLLCLSRELSAIFGFCGEGNLAFGLVDTRLVRPVKPLSFRFCC